MGMPAPLSMGTRGAGTKERKKSGRRTLKRSKPSAPAAGVAAPSARVKRRRAHSRTHGRFSRRLTRSRRAQLDGDQVVPGARPRGTALLRRQSRVTVQQPAGQPHRAFPRPKVVATEPQHPRANREHDRLDRVAQLAAGRGDRARLGVQRDDPPGRARAQAPSVSAAARSQPRTVPSGRPSCLAIGRCPAPVAARRSASPITSAPSRRRGTVHEGERTCVVSHAPQRARRGVSGRTSSGSRTSRERANPQGDNRPEQPGHASSPAANAASTHPALIAT